MTRSRDISREIVRLGVPALGALAADPLVSLVDTAFVGRLGTVELGALGVATAIFTLMFVTFNFLAYGTTSLVAQRIGAGQREGAARIVGQGVFLAVLIGLISVIIVESATTGLLGLMQAGDDVLAAATPYLRIRALAIPAVLLITVGHGAFRGFQDTATPLIVTLGLNLVNLVLDPLFIFGFGWGIRGAAIATLVAQWVGAIWFVCLFARSDWGIEWKVPGFHALRPFLSVGGALSIRTLALVGALTYATATAATIGTNEVAAHQVVSQWHLFLALVVDALAIAAQAMIGRFVGAGDQESVRLAARRLLTWGAWIGLALGVMMFLGRNLIAGWFTPDVVVQELVASTMVILALLQPAGALVFVADGLYLGAGAFRFLSGATVTAATITAVLLALVPGSGWGLAGVWWAIAALIGVRGIAFAIRYSRRLALS
ncbi:MAG: MATE family efflux transporter [Acidimicrobiia bacterium]|nr:MATE family efflux transporter [Acidimicrobiia bacterium]